MCGIFGCVGESDVTNFLIDGLKRLEYRGYDSAGLCIQTEDRNIEVIKSLSLIHISEPTRPY